MATTPQSPQTVPAARTDKLLTIEAARGIAALLVAFFHGAHVVELAQPGRGAPFGGFFSFGHAGVPFFFVLSGYIIYYIHHADLDRPGRLGSFAWKRVTRIYPLYLIVMVLITAKTWFAGTFAWDYWVKSVLLLPQSQLPMLVQSWTLVHEMLFYALFGLAIWRVRLSRWVLLAWAILFCAARVVDLPLPAGLFGDTVKTLASPYNLLFILGMGVAWVLRHRTVTFPRLLALAGGLAFLATGLVEDTGLYKSMAEHGLLPVLLYGVSSAFIIIGLVAAETAGTLRMGRIGALLGALSYPLYLTHGIAISITVDVARKLHYAGSGALLLTGAVAVACVAALAVHRCVEKPVAKWLRNVWARRGAAPAFT
ncbi:acyltransferase [Telluria mixta]|uniref:Acyltransferase n=1 Tax=Telluria mixta TaxID=34071 RepID=A0ABT2BY27_9BURK|nr:acyltransferase [Telluria mixta]MCS0630038.1 acyltransferase [Telluria mixta]WEM96412.1 acyltransferase [Telluria mixta]